MTANNRDELRKLWDKAGSTERGKKVLVGKAVVCDDCDGDFTDRPDQGGMIFQSKAICPTCAAEWLRLAREYCEEKYIRARCPENKSFADFVREYRGPDAFIRISGGQPRGND